MKLQLMHTNGSPPGTNPANELNVHLELKISDFRRFLDESRINEWFAKGFHGMIGGTYSVTWDNRHPQAQTINARIGAIGLKYWRFASREWSIYLLTIFQNGDGTVNNIVEDAVIDNTLIQGKTIRPLSGNYSNGWIYNGGTVFPASDMRVYWKPI